MIINAMMWWKHNNNWRDLQITIIIGFVWNNLFYLYMHRIQYFYLKKLSKGLWVIYEVIELFLIQSVSLTPKLKLLLTKYFSRYMKYSALQIGK
jgi:hypothetical protein